MLHPRLLALTNYPFRATALASSSPHSQVGLSKTKDALSVTEERAKQLSLDLQRTQMDLFAKTSEGRRGTAARLAGADQCWGWGP
jgi:hypothetical protein